MPGLRESFRLIAEDCAADANRDVPFTPLGLGTERGNMLAQIHALALNNLALLERIEGLERFVSSLPEAPLG